MSVGERIEAPSVFCGVNRSIVSGCFFVCILWALVVSRVFLLAVFVTEGVCVCLLVELIVVDWP